MQYHFYSLPDKSQNFTSALSAHDIEVRDQIIWESDTLELDLHHFIETPRKISPDPNEYF